MTVSLHFTITRWNGILSSSYGLLGELVWARTDSICIKAKIGNPIEEKQVIFNAIPKRDGLYASNISPGTLYRLTGLRTQF